MCRKEVLLQELKSASLQRSSPRMALLVLPKPLLQPKHPLEVLALLPTVCTPPQEQACSPECYMLSAFFLRQSQIGFTNVFSLCLNALWLFVCFWVFFGVFFWGGVVSSHFLDLHWAQPTDSYLLPTLYFYSFVLFWNPKLGLYVASWWISKI